MPLLPRFVTGRSLLSFKFDREQSADANETHSGTGIALLSYVYMLCAYINTARPMLIRMVGASRCFHVDREHRASSAGEVMRGKSANVLHMTICGSYGTYALSRISLADIWKAASGGICA
jgi:hypothetical protein